MLNVPGRELEKKYGMGGSMLELQGRRSF